MQFLSTKQIEEEHRDVSNPTIFLCPFLVRATVASITSEECFSKEDLMQKR